MSQVQENDKGSVAKQNAAAFFVGVVFAIGLGLSGMTLPEKVIGFLDVTGDWDPSLAFVMGGAVLVYGISFRFVKKMPGPAFSPRFMIPTRRDITWQLLVGSGLFGIGWGLGGFCPGPALVSTAKGVSGMPELVVFLVAMISGMYLYTAGEKAIKRVRAPKQTRNSSSANSEQKAASA